MKTDLEVKAYMCLHERYSYECLTLKKLLEDKNPFPGTILGKYWERLNCDPKNHMYFPIQSVS